MKPYQRVLSKMRGWAKVDFTVKIPFLPYCPLRLGVNENICLEQVVCWCSDFCIAPMLWSKAHGLTSVANKANLCTARTMLNWSLGRRGSHLTSAFTLCSSVYSFAKRFVGVNVGKPIFVILDEFVLKSE